MVRMKAEIDAILATRKSRPKSITIVSRAEDGIDVRFKSSRKDSVMNEAISNAKEMPAHIHFRTPLRSTDDARRSTVSKGKEAEKTTFRSIHQRGGLERASWASCTSTLARARVSLPSTTSSLISGVGPLSKGSLDSDLLTISEGTESIADLDPDNPIYSALNTAAERLVQDFNFRRNNLPREAPQGSCSDFLTSGSAYQGGQSYTSSSSKRRRADGTLDGGQDRNGGDDDDGGDDSRQNPDKRPRTAEQEADAARSLACPFWKHSPFDKHRDCYKYKLSRVRDVKQHLVRKHTPPSYCQRCFQIFDTEQLLDNHIETDTCRRVPGSQLDGITRAMDNSLRRRANPNHSTEEQWFAIWDLVFPGRQRPFSPYIDPALSTDLFHFREYWQNHAQDSLNEVLQQLDRNRESEMPDEERHANAQRILIMGMNMIYDTWSATQSRPAAVLPSLYTDAVGPSGSTTDRGISASSSSRSVPESGRSSQMSGALPATNSELWPTMPETFEFSRAGWPIEHQVEHHGNYGEREEHHPALFDDMFETQEFLDEPFESQPFDLRYGGNGETGS
ncbi:hypothetical protein B0T16DRAFT_247326 [Cercophora newfieldiana]|uniref:Uncharacterized protein n=1 Tax=Cercophora newfieldiana TaxID=92897 RepID=A0AA39XUK9_9PEZI|nr:hypothetical protein B0T16DRAFT_247326 [Cercophora newfieldiana]